MDPEASAGDLHQEVALAPDAVEQRTGTDSLWSATTVLDGEGSCCRVCHGEAEESRPLFHPCRCNGSIKFVHQDCLQTWLKVSKQSRPKCELCGEHFHFRNIYASPAGAGAASGSPPALSVLEFAHGVYTRVSSSAVIIAETAVVATLWMVVMPLATFWWVELTHCYLFGAGEGEDCRSLFTLRHFPTDALQWVMFWWEGLWNAIIVLFSALALMQVTQPTAYQNTYHARSSTFTPSSYPTTLPRLPPPQFYHFLLAEARKFRGVLRLAALNASLRRLEERSARQETRLQVRRALLRPLSPSALSPSRACRRRPGRCATPSTTAARSCGARRRPRQQQQRKQQERQRRRLRLTQGLAAAMGMSTLRSPLLPTTRVWW